MDGLVIAVFVGMFGFTYIIMNWFSKKTSSDHKHPPCLRTVPLFGSLPFLAAYEKMSTDFMSKSDKLGNVIAFYLGNRYAVILNGFDAMHEAFSKRSVDYASRSDMYVNHTLCNPNWKGLIDRPYDAAFKKNHQLSLSILKSFGFGQTIMEDRILIEVDELVAHFRKINGESIFPRDVITTYVLNVIASIMFGSRYDEKDPKLEKLVSAVHHFVANSTDLIPLNLFPPLRFLPSLQRAMKKVLNDQKTIFDIIEERLKIAKTGGCSTSFVTSFIDAAAGGGNEEGDYDKEELVYTMRDLLVAGTETSATTLQWILIVVANHPEVQKRIQRDIDSVVSRDRLPSLGDKPKLPYVEATISEVMRYKTIIPMGVAHETLCDTEVGGYFIPKKTMVISNIHSCHMDAKSWTNPEQFCPERFLDSENKLILRDRMVSFSMGKRSCFGEMLARQEIYLFFTGLLQNFDILPPEGCDRVEFKELYGVTVGPDDYKIRLVPRSIPT